MQSEDFKLLAISAPIPNLSYQQAKALADQLIDAHVEEPMLVAWYDGKKGEEHPEVHECSIKPGWIAYAEGHGGCIQVDVNGDEYRFIYADLAVEEL